MENLNNLPPFYVGQKVVCINNHPENKSIKYGNIYKIINIKKDCCNDWVVDIGIRYKTDKELTQCTVCGDIKETDFIHWIGAFRFNKTQELIFPSLKMSKVLEKESQLISMN